MTRKGLILKLLTGQVALEFRVSRLLRIDLALVVHLGKLGGAALVHVFLHGSLPAHVGFPYLEADVVLMLEAGHALLFTCLLITLLGCGRLSEDALLLLELLVLLLLFLLLTGENGLISAVVHVL
jgi:hypothetical protein